MQIDEAGIARRLGVAVGHADHAGLLQAEHVVDVVGPVAQERQFGRAGIAEHGVDAERAQQVESGLLDGEGGGGSRGFAGQGDVTSVKNVKSNGRHCEQSEAIHPSVQEDLDCFVAALLAMTTYHVAVPFMIRGCSSAFAVHSFHAAAKQYVLVVVY